MSTDEEMDDAEQESDATLDAVPASIRARVEDLAGRLVSDRGNPLLVIIDDYIDRNTSLLVMLAAKRFRIGGHDRPLDVLLHSPGGSLTESYRIARLLARSCNEWTALVPSQATSGATLVVLGSCNVIMGDFAFLGPIDPQVSSRRRERFFEVERQSSLEAFQALDYLQEVSLQTLDTTMQYLMRQQVNPEVALKYATIAASQMIQPIVKRIEPYALGAFSRDTILSREYAKRIAQPISTEKRSQRTADFDKLVADYPAHEFMIDREEAESLGLATEAPSADLEWLFVDMGLLFDEVERYIGFFEPAPDNGEDENGHENSEHTASDDDHAHTGNPAANGHVTAESAAVP